MLRVTFRERLRYRGRIAYLLSARFAVLGFLREAAERAGCFESGIGPVRERGAPLPRSTNDDRQPDRSLVTAIIVAIIQAAAQVAEVWVARGGHLL